MRCAAFASLIVLALCLTACGGAAPALDPGADPAPLPEEDVRPGPEPIPQPPPTWALSNTGSGNCWCAEVEVWPDGSSVVAGQFDGTTILGTGSPQETTLVAVDGIDVFLARFDPLGNLLWARAVQGMDSVSVGGLDVSPDGSVYLGGALHGSALFGSGLPGEVELVSDDGDDGFVARYNADGNLLWVRQIDSALYDEAHDVTARPDGSVVVTGLYTAALTLGAGEPGETTLVPSSFCETFLATYGPDGGLLWATSTASSASSYAGGWGLAAHGDGAVSLIGDFTGTTVFGLGEAAERTLVSVEGSTDVYIAHFGPDGVLQWVTSAGGPGSDYAGRLAVAPGGGLRAVGMFSGEVVFGADGATPTTLSSAGDYDGYLASYDPDGCLLWVRQVAGEAFEYVNAVRVLSDGGTILVSSFENEVLLGQGPAGEHVLVANSPGGRECAVIRYGMDGGVEWSVALGGLGDDFGAEVAVLADGSLLLAGGYQQVLELAGEEILPSVPNDTDTCAYLLHLTPEGSL